MNVGELSDLLVRLPAEMPVMIDGRRPGLFHLARVQKDPARTAHLERGGLADGPDRKPGLIRLGPGFFDSDRRYWYEPEPPAEVTGRWPGPPIPAELGARR
ncbi:MAG: hypothetical protein ACRDXE_07445 [Acidimicrobiales bacterium]